MSSSVGPSFPTGGINPGHIHKIVGGNSYEYIGGDVTDLVNSWRIIVVADSTGQVPANQDRQAGNVTGLYYGTAAEQPAIAPEGTVYFTIT